VELPPGPLEHAGGAGGTGPPAWVRNPRLPMLLYYKPFHRAGTVCRIPHPRIPGRKPGSNAQIRRNSERRPPISPPIGFLRVSNRHLPVAPQDPAAPAIEGHAPSIRAEPAPGTLLGPPRHRAILPAGGPGTILHLGNFRGFFSFQAIFHGFRCVTVPDHRRAGALECVPPYSHGARGGSIDL
jgi:hypothetical protein